MSKSELIIEFTIKATNTHMYKEVVLGTYTFACEPQGTPMRLVKKIGNDIGFSKDMNRVFLDKVEIVPYMIEMKDKEL